MRRHASPHWAGGIREGSWRWHGRGRENKRRKNPSRMPSFPHARREESGVACGRRSRHEPLRAPGRTRSGDLPLTRRTLYRLSYRGGCRKPPAVRRRPPRARHGPWGRTGRRACRPPVRGARRFRGAGRRGPACVCSIESGPCERVDVFHVSGRFWSTSACGEKRTPARPAWTSFPS